MQSKFYKIKSRIWLYQGMAGWHFVNIDKKLSKKIKNVFGGISGGFGSLPVTVTVGDISWKTSIFPDKKSSTYLLPLKAVVRKKENLKNGDTINFTFEIKV